MDPKPHVLWWTIFVVSLLKPHIFCWTHFFLPLLKPYVFCWTQKPLDLGSKGPNGPNVAEKYACAITKNLTLMSFNGPSTSCFLMEQKGSSFFVTAQAFSSATFGPNILDCLHWASLFVFFLHKMHFLWMITNNIGSLSFSNCALT